jgi:hypothetical protein
MEIDFLQDGEDEENLSADDRDGEDEENLSADDADERR